MFLIHLCRRRRRRRRRRLCDETRDTKTWSKEKDGDGRMSAYQCLPAEPTDRPTDQPRREELQQEERRVHSQSPKET